MNLNLPKIKVPVLQNRVFDSNESAKNSDYGYMEIRKNNNTGIYENGLFDETVHVSPSVDLAIQLVLLGPLPTATQYVPFHATPNP